MRRVFIQLVLPTLFCVIPLLAAGVIVLALPLRARLFYLGQLSALDILILSLGALLFVVQLCLSWQALRWRGQHFNEIPDRWLTHLAQAAEWFPLLGLLGTVAGILQTFGSITGQAPPERIIALYAPAITATGSGLLMALLNILPTWVVLLGRDLLLALAGGEATGETAV